MQIQQANNNERITESETLGERERKKQKRKDTLIHFKEETVNEYLYYQLCKMINIYYRVKGLYLHRTFPRPSKCFKI